LPKQIFSQRQQKFNTFLKEKIYRPPAINNLKIFAGFGGPPASRLFGNAGWDCRPSGEQPACRQAGQKSASGFCSK
jgi:hypothetical protein